MDCGDDKCADLTVLHDYLYYLIASKGQQYLEVMRIFVVLSKQYCVKALASQRYLPLFFFRNITWYFWKQITLFLLLNCGSLPKVWNTCQSNLIRHYAVHFKKFPALLEQRVLRVHRGWDHEQNRRMPLHENWHKIQGYTDLCSYNCTYQI